MNESTFWTKLRKGLESRGLWLQRVENLVGVGFPDVLYLRDGGFSPMELKYQKAFPKKDSTKVFGRDGLNPDQIAWWRKAERHAMHGFIAAGVGKEMFLISSEYAEYFNEMTRIDLGSWSTIHFEGRIDFDRLALVLYGR